MHVDLCLIHRLRLAVASFYLSTAIKIYFHYIKDTRKDRSESISKK